MRERELRVRVGDRVGDVTAVLLRPPDAERVLVLAHGAGAGMRHPFMDRVATRLADRGTATLRYQFPYMHAGKRRPDPPGVMVATVRAACAVADREVPELPLFAGGKSMGGRMTSQAGVDGGLPGVRGLVFFGFPLHAAGRPSTVRADHLSSVHEPMLFLQGTRDALADLTLLGPICDALGDRARLHIVEEANHSFHMPKRSGRTDDEVLDELADEVSAWAREPGVGG